VLSGQLIDLFVTCGAGTYTNVVWELPTGNFKKFEVVEAPPTRTGTLVAMSAADLASTTVKFYMNGVGSLRTFKVTFTFRAAGTTVDKTCKAEATLTLENPTLDLIEPTSIGSTVFEAPASRPELHHHCHTPQGQTGAIRRRGLWLGKRGSGGGG
jgi:hypothetical protein